MRKLAILVVIFVAVASFYFFSLLPDLIQMLRGRAQILIIIILSLSYPFLYRFFNAPLIFHSKKDVFFAAILTFLTIGTAFFISWGFFWAMILALSFAVFSRFLFSRYSKTPRFYLSLVASLSTFWGGFLLAHFSGASIAMGIILIFFAIIFLCIFLNFRGKNV